MLNFFLLLFDTNTHIVSFVSYVVIKCNKTEADSKDKQSACVWVWVGGGVDILYLNRILSAVCTTES